MINYDLPEVPDNYVHRIGRTARAGREGEGIAFCAPDELDQLKQIQKLMKIDIPVASGTMPEFAEPKKPRKQGGVRARRPQGGNTSSKPSASKRRRPRRRPAA